MSLKSLAAFTASFEFTWLLFWLPILTEFPDLDNVELINFDTRRETKNGKPNAFFSPLAMENGQYRSIVKFNFNEPEVYFDGIEGGGELLWMSMIKLRQR